jgi:hypothetical protein
MLFTQIEISPFLETLLSQSALVILLGLVVWTLWRKLEAAWLKIEQLAEGLIKITMLWEERYSKDSYNDLENKALLKEIVDIVRKFGNGK